MTVTDLSEVDFLRLQREHPRVAKHHYLEWVAAKGRESFWFFLRDVLKNPVLYEPLHRPIADWLQHDRTKLKKMLMMARGHVKSNVFTVGYALWRAVCNPNIRILLDSHKDKDAAKFLRLIRNYVETPWFRKVYPEIHPAMRGNRELQWNEGQALIKRDRDLVEATWEVSSITAEVTGRHYDLIIADDMVTKDNVNTADLIEKTTAHHQLLESLLDPGGEECIIGTRYHYSDEYGRIESDEDLRGEYDMRTIPAVTNRKVFEDILTGRREWSRDLDFDALAYPTRFTMAPRDHVDPDNPANNRKSLVAIRRIQGTAVFANQYMLEPFDPSDAVFDERNIRMVDRVPDTKLDWYRFMDISSEVVTPDSFTAIWTIAVDERCNIYCTDLFHGNFDGTRIIAELIQGQQVEPEVRPKFIGAEKGPYERSLRSFLERAAGEQKVWIPLQFLPGTQSNKPKDERIMGLQPWVEAGKIHFVRTCRNMNIALEEFTRFPKFIRKDCIDALAQFPPLIFPNGGGRFLSDPMPEINGTLTPATPTSGRTFDQIIAGMKRDRVPIGHDRVMAGVRLGRAH